MIYKYFVSWWHGNDATGTTGFGNSFISTNHPVDDYDIVGQLQNDIKEKVLNGETTPILLWFQIVDTKEEGK